MSTSRQSGWYRVGEFADLCGVPKDTLLYYDRIGLFSPAHIGKNGYRYYAHDQLYQIGFIHLFREIGIPIKQIRDYVDSASDDRFLTLLHESDHRLEQAMRRSRQLRELIGDAVDVVEKTTSATPGKITIEQKKAHYFVASPVLHSHENDSEEGFVADFEELLDYCREHGIDHQFFLCEAVYPKQLRAHDYSSVHLALKLYAQINCERLLVQPAGTYATIYYSGGHLRGREAYAELMRFASNNGYSTKGPLFQTNSSPLTESAGSSSMRAIVQVERKGIA